MTVYYVVAILAGIAGLITPLTYLIAKLTKPIKKMAKDTESNKAEIDKINEEVKKFKAELKADIKSNNDFAHENRTITMKSLIAILEGLEEQGCNGSVTKTKKELISFMAKNMRGGKK